MSAPSRSRQFDLINGGHRMSRKSFIDAPQNFYHPSFWPRFAGVRRPFPSPAQPSRALARMPKPIHPIYNHISYAEEPILSLPRCIAHRLLLPIPSPMLSSSLSIPTTTTQAHPFHVQQPKLNNQNDKIEKCGVKLFIGSISSHSPSRSLRSLLFRFSSPPARPVGCLPFANEQNE